MTARQFAERVIMTAIGEKPRALLSGSIRFVDGQTIDWTQKTPRGLVARTSHVHHIDLRDVLIALAEGRES